MGEAVEAAEAELNQNIEVSWSRTDKDKEGVSLRDCKVNASVNYIIESTTAR